MRELTRRDVLGGTVGAATVFAGCSESSSSGAFTQTAVADQQLIVEFEESLDAETISVIDPDGESFAETTVSAGASRVTFDIEVPYSPGEYRIVAAEGDETIAETTQEIRPQLEVVDVGVGANRIDEMPEELGHTKEEEAIFQIRNSGNGPERISTVQFLGDIPNPKELDETQIGVYDPESRGEPYEPVQIESGEQLTLFSGTLPFSFEGNGVDCSPNPEEGELIVEVRGQVTGWISSDYRVEYSGSEMYDGCDISIKEVE